MSTLSGTTSKSQWPFSPQSIPGLSLWLDGADTSSITGTSTVTAWKDKSGKGNHASGTGGLSYTAGQGITFNGTNGYFSVPGVANSIVGTPFTVFVAEKVAVLPPSGLPMGIFTNDPNTGVQYGGFFTCYNNSGSVTFGWYAGDQTSSTTYSVGSTRILNFNYTGTNRTILVNGTSVATESWTQNLITGAFTQPVIGRLWGTYYYNGTISELMLYIGNINTQQYQQVEGYLAQKWGLQANLPATHPYYATSTMQLYQRPVFQRTFQPVDIPGLSLWLDAADASSLTISSGNVTAWKDKSGNGYSFTKASYSGGTITLSSSNGNSTVNLGSNVMTTSSFPWTTWNTMFFVVSTNTWIYSIAVTDLISYFATGNWSLLFNGQIFQDANVSQGTDILTALSLTNQYCLLVIGYGGGTQASNYAVNGTVRYTTLGTSSGNGTINPGTALPQSTTTAPLWINGGSSYNYGSSTFVAEIVHYNTALTSSQRQQVESYLAWKWGLVSPLSTGHPGKLLPAFSGAFIPKFIPGLQLWLDAADATTITGTSPVTSWADKSGNGNNGTPISSGPTLVQNVQNGLPGITFPTTASIMLCGNVLTGTNFSMLAVIKYTNSGIEQFALGEWKHQYGSNLAFWKGGSIYATVSATTYSPFGPIALADTSAFHMYSASLTSSTSSSSATLIAGTDGNVATYTSTSGPNTAGTQMPFSVGGDYEYNTGYYPLTGYMCEVIVYNSALTANQLQQVEGYLAWKWGLQNNLPDTHAYKKIKP